MTVEEIINNVLNDVDRVSNGCFASNRNSIYADARDKGRRIPCCYVLRPQDSAVMRENGYCGTKYCPFYKKSRKEVRLD